MNRAPLFVPQAATAPAAQSVPFTTQFSCIGSSCEDTCCTGWTVPVDPTSFERFGQLPPSQLKTDLLAGLERKAPPSPHFAVLRMDPESHSCPLLASDGLCRLQAAHGEQALADTCRQYPRYKQTINGQTELSLALSCPEASRLVLLHPNLLGLSGTGKPQAVSAPPSPEASTALEVWAGPIRNFMLWLISGNRSYPLWQRMFMLRILCHRLDGLVSRNEEHRTPRLLADFEQRLAVGSLRPALDRLASSTEAQLDAVLQLAGLLLGQSNLRPRFLEAVHAFTTGIGNGPGATLASLAEGYERARDAWFSPFLVQHPYVLENWLANAILRHRFPFGRRVEEGRELLTALEQFEALAANFALIRGLLIGVAGFHQQNFNAAHVVHTVQSASKHFEHHPDFLPKARTLLATTHLNDVRGMALLLHEGLAQHSPLHSGIEVPAQVGILSA